MEQKSYPVAWYVICWIVYALYCYAAFFPTGPVWGIHWIAYTPQVLKIAVLVLGVLLLVPKNQQRLFHVVLELFHKTNTGGTVRIVPSLVVAIAAFFIFHFFEIKTDI